MPSWTVKADQHQADYEEVTTHLKDLGRSIHGLSVTLCDPLQFQHRRRGSGFRSFASVAIISHDELQVLETVAEELIAQFGWVIDLSHDGP